MEIEIEQPSESLDYEKPRIEDHGSLVDLTAGIGNAGPLDASYETNPNGLRWNKSTP